jgi:hypothetical protein
MTKLEYLKFCIQNRLYSQLAWLVSIFSITTNIDKTKLTTGSLIYEFNSCSFIDQTGQLVKIADAVTQPLFSVKDLINIDSSWLPIVKEPTETTVGRLIANAICLYEPFRANIDYINKRFSVGTIEALIAPILKSNPENPEDMKSNEVYVKDYIDFLDNLHYLANLSSIVVVSATPKIITKPEGIDDFIKELIQKYKGKLHDPVEFANFEGELKKFDNEYLKDDPAYGIFISGKVQNIARKKLFLTIGVELDFKEKAKLEPILSSLSQGWKLNPKEFRLMMNGIRYGSFSRGAETVKGGVTFKTLIRSTNNFKIVEEDCGSKLTLPRTYDGKNIIKLVDRYIVNNNKVIFIDNIEQAKQYLNKEVQLRSPIYCKTEGDRLCSICVGKKITQHKDSLAIMLSEISAVILKASLKVMHGTVLSTAEIDLNKHFS